MSPETKKNLLTAASYAVVLLIGLLLGRNFVRESAKSGNNGQFPAVLIDRNGKLQQLMEIVGNNYVDVVGVDTLQDYAIKNVLSKLDPHSTYMPPAVAREMGEDLNGNFDGIGVEYYRLRDTLMITGVTPNGPAEQAGIRNGDKLLAINNKLVSGVHMKEQEVAAMVRGKIGTTVNLSISRNGRNLSEPIKVTRNKIVVSSIPAAYIIDTAIAYIKVKRFGAQTVRDFKENLNRMKQYGVNSLILDLRGNNGGFLQTATTLASEFFKEKKILVYTQGAHEPRTVYYSKGNGSFAEGKVAVLIDENSASASEIVAGAIQDWDRGIVVGRRSFGKGLVQDQYDFEDGSAVNLTIARYYTPSGRSIQKSYKDGLEKYFGEISRRYQSGELTHMHQDSLADTTLLSGTKYYTSNGRTIYGGGGIMPDIYVPLDTTGANALYERVSQVNLIQDYVYTHLISSPPDYSIDHYITHYQLPSRTYLDFIQEAKERGITVSNKESKEAREWIEEEMRALVARFFFGNEAYFKVKNQSDRVVKRAVEALKS